MEGSYVPKTKITALNITSELYEWTASIVFALAIIALIFAFLVRPVSISGNSMQNTLQNNDKVITTNFIMRLSRVI